MLSLIVIKLNMAATENTRKTYDPIEETGRYQLHCRVYLIANSSIHLATHCDRPVIRFSVRDRVVTAG
jgi:hypothetical protein